MAEANEERIEDRLAADRSVLQDLLDPADDLDSAVASAIEGAQLALLSQQTADGHWCAELEGDTILESEYILTFVFLGRQDDPRLGKAAEYLRRRQQPGGGWSLFPGGPPDVNPTVKACLALGLLGEARDAPHMQRARQVILELGGLRACNSFTRILLAIFGQLSWADCPAVPPELVLFPRWAPLSIWELSAWSRTIVVPLSIVWACKPFRPVPAAAALTDLVLEIPRGARSGAEGGGFWSLLFSAIDALNKGLDALGIRPLRRRALRVAEQWVRQRSEESDGLGAIFPPIVNTILALTSLGYGEEDPVVAAQLQALAGLEIEEGDALRVQPCKSPVWDTALAVNALVESGLPPSHPVLQKAGSWLLEREVRRAGDWRTKNRRAPIGGWYFEYANEFYPDCDDTAQVLTSLAKVEPPEEEARRHGDALQRGLEWMLAMQNGRGGWASFDRACDLQPLEYVPFADHNAIIDPPTADVTGRTLEALATLGLDVEAAAVRRAATFLRREQEPDGSWYGRWGCNYLYGTWLALQGLAKVGEETGQPWAQTAASWVRSCQNADGGWGETPASYDDPVRKGIGPSSASQTSWALLALFAVGDFSSSAVRRGVDYLLQRQRSDGSWDEEQWTGTGFPRVFYLRYHNYRLYFPLQALSAFAGRQRHRGDRVAHSSARHGAVQAGSRPKAST